ncbi:peptidylprolyl isomerase [Pseudoalteromonas sp. MMG012]|uniref:peptidylprolyl isomerase n=1 Tax=Pseudoalteromonas sp. MMG012 TaxID=2822686 RepID=UPI001B3A248B|nr:peptidylprolyl isomerase [Pseudoalteromonas sp. MMG012]MBQ4852827.1 peptidylprolyl isomerase [Pseudoalteromonas sp. MMG012]
MIVLKTNFGDIEITLDFETTPITAKNFLQYCQDGFYQGTIFHRVIKGFMVQGGGFTAKMKEKPTRDTIVNEANKGLKNTLGTIAMARTDAPHSASAQFFINVTDNAFLDHFATTNEGWGYCAFGKVTAGIEVVHAIEKVKTGMVAGHDDVPFDPIVIEAVEINT